MRLLRWFSAVAVIVPLLSIAQTRPASRLASEVASATNGALKLVYTHPDGPQLISANGKGYQLLDPDVRNDRASVRTAVTLWVGRYAQELFGIGADAELREYETERVGKLWQTSFELFYNGIPVRERYLKINTGALSGSILLLRSNLPTLKPNAASPAVDYETINHAALDEIAAEPKEVSGGQLVYIDNKTMLQLAYEIVAGSPNQERWRLTYDALTGKLLEKKDLLIRRCFEHDGMGEEAVVPHSESKAPAPAGQTPQAIASGRVTAFVHPSKPSDQLVEVGLPAIDITVNGVTTQTDSLGYWTLPSVSFPLIIKTGLQNAYLSVRPDASTVKSILDTITTGFGNIVWDNSNSTQSERDGLYSLLRARAHIKSIQPDLENIDQLLRADVDYNAACNAFYDADSRSFTFFTEGGGCKATAQIADVVFHEYGHRVNHCRYLGTEAKNMWDGSLGEGFADIYSAFMRDDSRIGIGFFDNQSRILRNCENAKKWPTNIDPDVHVNGMIVAGAYWDLRKATGLPIALNLFHSMMQLTPDGNGGTDAESLGDAFTNVLVTTILADDDDNDLSNGTPHLDPIIQAFKKHNITLANLLELSTLPIPDQNVSASSYAVTVNAAYSGPVGALDENSITLFYSADGKSYTPIALTKSSGNAFEGAIPKMPSGSIIRYYVSGATTLGDVNESPSAKTPLLFLVGFESTFSDDFETNKNWLTGSADDSATSGIWTRGEPKGTTFPGADNFFVQQDTDHTATGSLCFVTGNTNTTTPSIDDVDNGATTLTSPLLNLAKARDPLIRYWFHYSNDLGQNPGVSKWVVELGANGTNWTQVVSTKAATDGWQQMLVRVKDYMTPADAMQVRFIASDYIGSLVEAGVDDFEVLDPVQGSESVTHELSGDGILLEVYPQPAARGQLNVRIKVQRPSALVLSIRDLLGAERIRMTSADILSEHLLTVDLRDNLPSGVYTLEVRTETATITKKLVVTK